ncbi:N-acetylglucosamine-6-phosphate deacetylase [Mesobacillus foraminis]|uniref:N-acetylglucosamine-6-phosphate deacetylase n=1 Tax=Mesobacillus foraminis TaxID=279826 RepID=UPI001BEA9FA9|nr:N-acetylglucosamine-6-phosphate deacetylase [Mesobacillus foraminis]MBT2758703.1 N-acetylglucosamine-6-phosphate deacetylase [Mesobacillus foraminis]
MNNQNPTRMLLKNIQIYAENMIIENGFIKIEGEKIVELGEMAQLRNGETYLEVDIPPAHKAIPGLIDVHIHGVAGADTMDATPEALETMAKALPGEGTTSFLATTITQGKMEIEKALENAAEYINHSQAPGKAEILGVHLEGPFVNEKRAGAQPVEHMVKPDTDLFNKWQELSQKNIKLVTLAPEIPGGLELVKHLRDSGVVASIGHSDASFEEVKEAAEAGATQVTHLYNQMRGFHHREPGVVGAAFLLDELMAEIIVDGIHARPEAVKIAFKQKGSEGLILITDSMRAKCLKNGVYDLGGQDVTVEDGKAVLCDGTLAGSILKLGDGVKNIMAYTGCGLEEAIEMTSGNPAKQLNVYDRKGSIAPGKDGDLVILDEEHNIYLTLCKGKIAYRKAGENAR